MAGRKRNRPSAQATEDDIKRAARRLFAQQGFVATTIREIARAAAIEGGSIYYHFRGKDDVLVAILEEGNRTLLAAARAALAQGGEPETDLRRLIGAHLRVLAADPDQMMVVTRELQRLKGKRREQIIQQREAYQQVFEGVLERGIAQGAFGACDPKLMTFAILGLLNSVVNWFSAAGPKSIDELADEFTRMLLGGLLAGAPRAIAYGTAGR